MIIDKATPRRSTSEGSSFTAPPPSFSPGPFTSAVPEEQSSVSNDLNPSYAPPSYEAVAAVSSPRATSIERIPEKSRPLSAGSPPLGQLNLVAPAKRNSCCCSRVPEDHFSPCFSRLAPSASDSGSYLRLPSPFVIHPKPGVSTLEDSFAITGTPALQKHDVLESDWEELLGDVRAFAQLTPGQRAVFSALPATRHLGPPGYLLSTMAEQGIKKRKAGDVAGLLDIWNEKFFNPRRLEVILCRGDKRKSGSDIMFLPPDRTDGPLTNPSKQRGGCCSRSQKQKALDKPWRLVVVSI